MTGRLKDKVAMVTGGGSGIGRACALRFAEEGAAVCVIDRDANAAQRVSLEVKDFSVPGMAMDVDVTDEAAVDAAVELCVERLGAVDVLASAAGVGSPRDAGGEQYSVMTIPTQDFRNVLDVNLFGTLFADRAVIRWLIADGRSGSVINFASVMAKVPTTRGAYNVSKAGVWMLTKCMALEVAARDIRVNAIGPGFIETPMIEATLADPDQAAQAVSRAPMRRLGTPEEVAAVAVFLASNEASFVTGEMLHPSGGMFVG